MPTSLLGRASLVLCWFVSLTVAAAAPPVWIYKDIPPGKDTRSETERTFAPGGFMPAERAVDQIAVNPSHPIDASDDKKGTCIKYVFKFKETDDWQGVYTLVQGTAWGSKPGINVQKLLGVGAKDVVECRFRARGEVGGEVVTFQCGGVDKGDHASSLSFPVTTAKDPLTLSKEFRDYSISLTAGQLTNLIDPFCVVARARDNPERKKITLFVDDIRYDVPRKERGGALPRDWRERLEQTFFVCYTPTGFDPTARPIRRPSADDIRADLSAIRALADKAGVKGARAGIITYGCRDGLEAIAPLAKEVNLSVILGIFNPRDKTEIQNAEKLLQQDDLHRTLAACCVGNEALTFRRATLDEIRQVVQQLSLVRRVPMTTTEIIQAYGEKRLFEFDFSFVNAHALFSSILDPQRGASWAAGRLKALLEIAPPGHLILAKELGWPAGPEPAFDSARQESYWKTVFASPVAQRVNVCIFDGLANVPWKNEMVTVSGGGKVNVGPHWPVLFDAERKPKATAEGLVKLWLKSRAR